MAPCILTAPPGAGGAPPGGETVPALFRTTWSTSVGVDEPHIYDGPGPSVTGARWNDQGWCGRADILAVVSAASVGSSIRGNLLRSTYRGTNGCRFVQRTTAVPALTSHWGRIYYRREENSWPGGMHNTAYNFLGSIQCVPFQPNAFADGSGWHLRFNAVNFAAYPYGFWICQTGEGAEPGALRRFDLHRDYRYEWHLEYVDSGTRFRLWPRLYDDTNTLVADAHDFYHADNSNAGLSPTINTLAQWYAADGAFAGFDASLMRNFGIGNEGRLGAPDNGMHEYFGDVCLTTDGWAGNREATDP